LRFVEKHGERAPILLWGVSNGARLWGALEVWMRGVAKNPVLVSAVAVPFLGTKSASLVGAWAKRLGVFSADVVDELTYNSLCAQNLVKSMAELTRCVRRYYFYATRQDDLVFPVKASTPVIHQNETVIVMSGHDHASIIDAVAKHQKRSSENFVMTSSI
jgi:hypothetical protein